MKQYFKSYFRNFDYGLLFVYIFLMLFGLVMIYSSSIWVAIVYKDAEPNYYYYKQLTNIFLALVVFFAAAIIPYRNLKSKQLLLPLMILMIVLELWVTFAGHGKEETGSQSWISLFGLMNFQPSEFAKLFILVFFAGTFYRKSVNKGSIQLLKFDDISYPLGMWLFILGCVALETDLGALMIIFVVAVAVVLASGLRGKTLLKVFGLLTGLGVVLVGTLLVVKWDSISTVGRMGRFTSYLDPFAYAKGAGYQVVNGYYAIGSGGLEGKGLGQSTQKLGYIPEPQTDFIMAIIAEELGVLGVSIVILGLGFIVLRGFYIAMSTKDPLARMLATGISTWIGLQTFINLGGLSGIIPLTGVTLPFISYGGTSILLLSVAMGILINVSTHHKLEKRK